MIDCPFTPSNAKRLAQLYRPKSLVRSNPGKHIKGVNQQQPRPILGQTCLRNAETATFNLKNNVSAAASNPAHSALSP